MSFYFYLFFVSLLIRVEIKKKKKDPVYRTHYLFIFILFQKTIKQVKIKI